MFLAVKNPTKIVVIFAKDYYTKNVLYDIMIPDVVGNIF